MSKAFNDAIKFYQANELRAAMKACKRAILEDGESGNVHHLMGVLYAKKNAHTAAVKHLELAVALIPDLTEARFNLGKELRDLERDEDSLNAFQEVVQIWPTRADVWIELGLAFEKQGRVIEAISAYEKALDNNGETPELLSQLACAYMVCGELESAEPLLLKATTLDPTCALAMINLGVLRENQGRMNESLALYAGVVEETPDNYDALKRQALGLLTSADLTHGWRAYAARGEWPASETGHGDIDAPFWSGEDLSSRTLLVWTEQGPGDEILTASMFPDLRNIAGRVVLACSPRLKPIFERSFPWCEIVAREGIHLSPDIGSRVDVQASITELGAHLRASLDDFPEQGPYLKSDRSRVEEMRRSYCQFDSDRPLIGISWRSTSAEASSEKSSDLKAWADILTKHNCQFVALQYGDCSREIENVEHDLGISVTRDTSINPLTDMDSFVAQVAAMDLVISTTNTTVHVAGALGLPVWTLLPEGTGRPWYWFLERSDSPWYPSMRLYRQSTARDWSVPFAKVQHDLNLWIQNWSVPLP